MARIRQIRDVIFTRRAEDLDRSLTYEEIKTRAIMQASLVAGNQPKAADGVQSWRLPRPGDTGKKPVKEISTSQAQKLFGTVQPVFTPEQIAARAAELKAEGQQ